MSLICQCALSCALTVAACLLAVTASVVAREQPSGEMEVKAAFLTKFGQFVQWPADPAPGRSTFELCLSPNQPFGRSVELLAQDSRMQNLAVAVREVTRPDMLGGCRVLYLGRPTAVNNRLLDRARQLPILTVGEDPGFLGRGGIVRLRVVEAGGLANVRFDIHVANARRVGLQLSSQLLRLAVSIEGTN